MAKQIGIRELRQNLSRAIDDVRGGETLEVTRGGQPVARIVPVTHATRLGQLIAEGKARPALRPMDLDAAASQGHRPDDRQRGARLAARRVTAFATSTRRHSSSSSSSERESAALARWLGPRPAAISSEVAVVEVTRAVRLADERSQIEERSSRLLEEIALVRAEPRSPGAGRTESAHVCYGHSTLSTSPRRCSIRPDELVAYDERLLRAAADAGLTVASPGA